MGLEFLKDYLEKPWQNDLLELLQLRGIAMGTRNPKA